ncbi:MAG TPA: alcohol dehydrogenase catalytic domain-containing protein [Plantibacter sp.]|uniref:zinc-dependent alcohol dehydrogenase n=1 Tax=unclassified Plantibacter TaxID=2624265 RepID=UPI002BDC8CD8|nr:alcohol dehydrogenase catalytic domain-containing protein [Plantibacter sp.]
MDHERSATGVRPRTPYSAATITVNADAEDLMRAIRLTAPDTADVVERPTPVPEVGEVLIRIVRAGLCGTDVGLFRGTMPYLVDGRTRYPVQPGHEWAGEVVTLGAASTGPGRPDTTTPDTNAPDTAALQPGDLVTGDTFIGCDACTFCRAGRHHLCETHVELGVLGKSEGALGEYLVVPARAVHRLPDGLGVDLGALIEPASCSLRGVRVTGVSADDRVLVWGAGTLGMLAALFAARTGATVGVVARRESDRRFVESFGLRAIDPAELGHAHLPQAAQQPASSSRYDVIIEATGSPEVTRRLLDDAAPGVRIALLGVPGEDVGLPTNRLIPLDATVHAVLGGSAHIDEAASLLLELDEQARRLIGTVIALDDVPSALAAGLPRPAGGGPKTQVRLA